MKAILFGFALVAAYANVAQAASGYYCQARENKLAFYLEDSEITKFKTNGEDDPEVSMAPDNVLEDGTAEYAFYYIDQKKENYWIIVRVLDGNLVSAVEEFAGNEAHNSLSVQTDTEVVCEKVR